VCGKEAPAPVQREGGESIADGLSLPETGRQVLEDRVGNGIAIKRACASAQLVQNHERVGCSLREDSGSLLQLHHECRAGGDKAEGGCDEGCKGRVLTARQ